VHLPGRGLQSKLRGVFPSAPAAGALLAVSTFQAAAGGADLAPDAAGGVATQVRPAACLSACPSVRPVRQSVPSVCPSVGVVARSVDQSRATWATGTPTWAANGLINH
jgi:hypothetical protein